MHTMRSDCKSYEGVPNSEPDYMTVGQLQDVRTSGTPSHFAAQAKQDVDRITLPTSVRAEHDRQSYRPDSEAYAKTWKG